MRDEGDSIQLMAASIWYKTSQRGLIFITIIFNKQSSLLNDFKVCFIVGVCVGGQNLLYSCPPNCTHD